MKHMERLNGSTKKPKAEIRQHESRPDLVNVVTPEDHFITIDKQALQEYVGKTAQEIGEKLDRARDADEMALEDAIEAGYYDFMGRDDDEGIAEDPLAGDVDSYVPQDPAETHADYVARQHGDSL
jgi:hypothetical protein